MQPGMHAPPRYLVQWLLGASTLVAIFGLVLVMASGAARQGFSQLIYANLTAIDSFGAEAARYIALAHAVIGAVMVGWGIAMILITSELIASGSRLGWRLLAFSLSGWYVPDTLYSLASGYWQNAALNTCFAAIFVVPLALLHPYLRGST
jgi:hypothetical protein